MDVESSEDRIVTIEITKDTMENSDVQDISQAKLRELKLEDYPRILELWKNTPGMGLNDADSYENIDNFLQRNPGLSYIYQEKDSILGTVLCGQDGRRGYVYHVAVALDHRGRGIGRVLVEKCLQSLKAAGINKCHLFVFADNEIGKSFWSYTGWTKREDIFIYSRTI